MRMTASWFGSLDLPHTRLWCDSIAPKSGLPSDCHPAARSNRETDDGKNASPCLTQKAPYKGLSADSGEKHAPASDPDTATMDGLKALDPKRPIREATAKATSRAAIGSSRSLAGYGAGPRALQPRGGCSALPAADAALGEPAPYPLAGLSRHGACSRLPTRHQTRTGTRARTRAGNLIRGFVAADGTEPPQAASALDRSQRRAR